MKLLKSLILFTSLTLLILAIGYLVGGTAGLAIAFVLSIGMNVGSYWFSHSIVLRMYQAKPISASSHPSLWHMTEELAQRAKLPMPKLYIFESQSPNAFATGRNYQNAVVAVSDSLLRLLNEDELRGVIAHELAHVKNRDMLLNTVVASMVGAISFFLEMSFGLFSLFMPTGDEEEDGLNPIAGILLMLAAPLLATVIQFAISRSREFSADATGAQIAGSGTGLSNALLKLSNNQVAESHLHNAATSHLFIVPPALGNLAKLFSTHPPVEERVKKLKAIS